MKPSFINRNETASNWNQPEQNVRFRIAPSLVCFRSPSPPCSGNRTCRPYAEKRIPYHIVQEKANKNITVAKQLERFRLLLPAQATIYIAATPMSKPRCVAYAGIHGTGGRNVPQIPLPASVKLLCRMFRLHFVMVSSIELRMPNFVSGLSILGRFHGQGFIIGTVHTHNF